MSAETPGGFETENHVPLGDSERQETPGYPPPGQRELEAQLAQAEAAAMAEEGDPEALLDDLDSVESPSERLARLGDFVGEHFAEICPPELREAAAAECLQDENELRELFEDRNLELAEEDAADPALQQRIEDLVEVVENDADIDALSAQAGGNKEALATQQTEIDAERQRQQAEAANDEALQVAVSNDQSQLDDSKMALQDDQEINVELKSDTETIEDLQRNFEAVRGQQGTIGALEGLLGEDGVTNPEMRAVVQRVLTTAQSLVLAVPGKAHLVAQFLNQSTVDFSASSPSQIFAGFLAAADKSEELTEDEKETLRRVMGQSEADFQTGADAKRIAQSVEQIIDPETGEVIGEKYLHDSRENMAELRPNLGTYMDGERMMIATKDGLITRDVTGWSDEAVGMLAEVMDFHRFAESKGITGFVESLGNVRTDAFMGGAFDQKTMIQYRQVISALVGGGDGPVTVLFRAVERFLCRQAFEC